MRRPYDLNGLLLSATAHKAGTEMLQILYQATGLVEIRQALVAGEARLDTVAQAPDVDAWDVRILREVIQREADTQHGAVWPN